MTWGDPPREIRLAVPGYKTVLYLGAVLSVAGSLGGLLYMEMDRNAKLDAVVSAVGSLSNVPQQIATIISDGQQRERRITALEQARAADDTQYQAVMQALAGLQARTDGIAGDLAAVRDDNRNMLNALTGRPYTDSKGRVVK